MRDEINSKQLIWLLIGLTSVVFIGGLAWAYYVGWSLPLNEFANYFSGILAPILSFVTIIILLKQIEGEKSGKKIERELRLYESLKDSIISKYNGITHRYSPGFSFNQNDPNEIILNGEKVVFYLIKNKTSSFLTVSAKVKKILQEVESISRLIFSLENIINKSSEKEILESIIIEDLNFVLKPLKELSLAIDSVQNSDQIAIDTSTALKRCKFFS